MEARLNTVKLCGACRDGNIEVVEDILGNKEVNINGSDNSLRGGTPLTYAVKSGHLAIVRRLLQHPGVDINAPDSYDDTPLMCAVMRGYLDIVRTLLEVPTATFQCNNYG